ncbi:hypothetical protein Tco_0725926 [Tanacetum coccineum]|uniref:Uncharacterized protein n=1 Tax=Tanacetum coccineum TaxID=301880 RepID=A0ABQ4YGI0_9ASTR
MEMKRTANELLFAEVEYMRKRVASSRQDQKVTFNRSLMCERLMWNSCWSHWYWIIEFQGYIDQVNMLMECGGRSKGINKYTSTLQSQGAKDEVAMTVESARTSATEMSSPLYAA